MWPLNQIVDDTQFYVRDAVIDYIKAQSAAISPAIEGRLNFIYDITAPTITIVAPTATSYLHPDFLTLDFYATDDISGVKKIWADLDGTAVMSGETIDLYTLALGEHTLTVYAVDKAYNQSTASVTFTVEATIDSLIPGLNRLYAEDKISNQGVYNSLLKKLQGALDSLEKRQAAVTINKLEAFLNEVKAQSGKHITADAAAILIADAQWVIAHLK